MNIIEQVNISGFRGNHNLSLDLHKDINFLIGVNGSGKTTVINLVAADYRKMIWDTSAA